MDPHGSRCSSCSRAESSKGTPRRGGSMRCKRRRRARPRSGAKPVETRRTTRGRVGCGSAWVDSSSQPKAVSIPENAFDGICSTRLADGAELLGPELDESQLGASRGSALAFVRTRRSVLTSVRTRRHRQRFEHDSRRHASARTNAGRGVSHRDVDARSTPRRLTPAPRGARCRSSQPFTWTSLTVTLTAGSTHTPTLQILETLKSSYLNVKEPPTL